MVELVSYYQTNIQSIYNRIKGLYSKASPYFDQDVQLPELQVMNLNNPTDLLNRVVYQWTVSCTQQLQMVMNNVVGDFNDNDIIDEDLGDTPELKLWLPERLVVDDIYMLKLQNNFDECNELLDKLNSYTQEYMNY